MSLPGLNFHRPDDLDHFRIDGLPYAVPYPDAPGCATTLTVDAGPGVYARARRSDEILAEGVGPLEIQSIYSDGVSPRTPIMLEFREAVPGRLTVYDLSIAYTKPSDVLSALCERVR